MTMIIGDGKNQVHSGESGYEKKNARVSTLFRSGVLLCQYLAIIFLLAGSPSVVRAQAQNDTTKAPSVSSNVVVPDTTPSETSYTPTAHPTNQPTWLEASSKETMFRQEFKVGNGREFNDDEIVFMQTIYKQRTEDFAPLTASEVASKITTICTVDRQDFLIDVQTINVDYTMKYESKHYNMTQYPKLFQNWTNTNLDKLLEALTTLKMNVTEVEKARRIVISTPSPSYSVFSSTKPTVSPTITPVPSSLTEAPPAPSYSVGGGSEFENEEESNKTVTIVVIVVGVVFGIMAVVGRSLAQ